MKNILVTGCSRGIGYEIVKAFSANQDTQVLAIARDTLGLSKLKDECIKVNPNAKIHTLSIDLLASDAIHEIVNFITLNFNNKLDGIIHNAGFLVKKPFTEISDKELEDSFHVNCFAPFLLTQKLIPYFTAKANVPNNYISSSKIL